MPYCPKCGTQAAGNFCPSCGTAIGAQAGAPQAQAAGDAGLTEPVASALCYLLGFITGIIFLVVEPYSRNRNVRFHAFQSILLNVAIIVVWIVLTIVSVALMAIPVLGAMVSVLLHVCCWLGSVGLWLYLLIKTFSGAKVVLPVIGPMAEKQANG